MNYFVESVESSTQVNAGNGMMLLRMQEHLCSAKQPESGQAGANKV